MREHPRIIGNAAYGLSGDVSWAVNNGAARAGANGEIKTAAILDERAMRDDGPTVFHDLRIPIPGFNANLDHLVVSGNRILIIDTKAWKPGFLWTVGGKTFRGLHRFPSCDKKTVAMGYDTLVRYFAKRGQHVRFPTPLIVVWPTSQHGTLSTWAASFPGARIVTPAQLTRVVRRMHGAADPGVEQALTALVNGRKAPTASNPFTVGRF